MTREQKTQIKAFVQERDEILLALDVDRAMAFNAKHNPDAGPFSRVFTEIGIHKARTAAKSLPVEARMASKQWLTERGYQSLDDGDLS